MPWHISSTHPDCDGWAVVKDDTDEVVGCHDTESDAEDQLAALYANEEEGMDPKAANVTLRANLELMRETRRFSSRVEVRAAEGDKATIGGYAALFEAPYEVWDFFGTYEEVIDRGAFDKTLRDGADVRYFFDHEGLTLARTKSGTLTLSTDDTGLLYDAAVDRRQSLANDLVIAVERGDVDQSSFAFQVVRQEWSPDFGTRRLIELKLFDVSSVAYPMNEDTTAGLRDGSWLDEIARNASAFAELRHGAATVPEEMLDRAIDALQALRSAPEEEARDEVPVAVLLEQHRLDLLKLRG